MLKRIPARLTASTLAFLALILITAFATRYYLQDHRFDGLKTDLVVRRTDGKIEPLEPRGYVH